MTKMEPLVTDLTQSDSSSDRHSGCDCDEGKCCNQGFSDTECESGTTLQEKQALIILYFNTM